MPMKSWSLLLAVVLVVGLHVGPVQAQDASPQDTSAQDTSMQETASDSLSVTVVVEEGDTLYGIAREAGVSVRTLMAWNDLDDTSVVPGQTLRVRPPRSGDTDSRDGETSGEVSGVASRDSSASPPDSVESSNPVEPSAPPPFGRYPIEPGDTFASVALRAGLPADSLVALNDSLARRVRTDSLPPGDVLRLPRRFGPPTHVVERGQTLYAIAGEYGVSVRSLQRANDLPSTTLSPGQRLRVPGPTPPVPDTLAPPDTTGPVIVYPSTFAGRLTASGETYDPDALVGSHPTLPYGAVVHLTNPATGRSARVRIIDRGPVEDALLMDVSEAVADALGLPGDGNAPVELRVVWGTPPSDLFSSQP